MQNYSSPQRRGGLGAKLFLPPSGGEVRRGENACRFLRPLFSPHPNPSLRWGEGSDRFEHDNITLKRRQHKLFEKF